MSEQQYPDAERAPPDLYFRLVEPSDLNEVKALCADWFPIRYDDRWYEEVAYRRDIFISVIASTKVSRRPEDIAGLLVAEVKPISYCQNFDRSAIIDQYVQTLNAYPTDSMLSCYILILGVRKEMRKLGIASRMLEDLERRIPHSCAMVFLHVLDSNLPAIHFYEKQGFQRLTYLPQYYTIGGRPRGGFCYSRIRNHYVVETGEADECDNPSKNGDPPKGLIGYPAYFARNMYSWLLRQFQRLQF